MARLLSLIASNIRGSVGGLTYFSGPYHQIQMRSRTAPVQPNTNYQASIKSFFGSAVAAWEALDQDDRDGWAQYAQTVTLQGPLGSYQPSGRDLAIGSFTGMSYNRVHATGDVPVSIDMDPPEIAGQLAMTDVVVTAPADPGTGNTITFGNTGNSESIIYFASKSFVQSDSRFFYKGPFRANTLKSDLVLDGETGSVTFTQAPEGSVYFVRVRAFSAASPFRMSPPIILRCVSEETV